MNSGYGLLLAIAAGLLCMALGAILLLRLHRQQTILYARFEATVGPHRPVATRASRRPGQLDNGFDGKRLAAWAAGIFGFDVRRLKEYPVRWWVAVGGALIMARLGCGLGALLLGDVALFALPLLWVGFSRNLFGVFRNRHLGKLYRQFPDALAMIVRSVRTGIPVTESIRNVAREAPEPTRQEFARLADQLMIGVSIADALRDMAERGQLSEYRFFATALTLQSQTGGGLADTLDNLAVLIRKRVAMRARGHALASEARTSALVLTGLPVVVGLALAALKPEYFLTLFNDPLGVKLFVGALGSLGFGMFAMRTIINRSLS